jgi:uncharacterized membrane protein YfcA
MSWVWIAIASFFAGMFGSMGMGGGGILVIFLALFTQLPQATIQGINLLFFIPVAIFSVIIYQRHKLIKWRVVAPFAIAGVCTSILGAYMSANINDIWLKKAFGALLLVMGVKELFSKNKTDTEDS